MGSAARNNGFLRKLHKRLRRYRVFRMAKAWLYFLLFMTLFGDFIANDKPLFCRYEGAIQFPIIQETLNLNSPFNQTTEWDDPQITFKVYPLIPYHFDTIDPLNSRFVSPFGKQNIESIRYRHWLGTDQIGRDVLAGMIIGARVSLVIGFLGIGLSTLIGILLGSLSGYFGNGRLKWSVSRLVFSSALLIIFGWLAYVLPIFFELDGQAYLLGLVVLIVLVEWGFSKIPLKSKKVNIPMDWIVLRVLEIFKSIPKLLLVLVISAVFTPSIYLVAIVIGVTHWPMITMYLRGELLKVREKEYLFSAQLQGIPDWKVLFRHAIPNAIGPALIAIMLGLGSAILAESFLSFLGLGIPPDLISWGKLLASARENVSAWWLAVFPGMAIFLTIYSANRIGELLLEEIKAG